MGILTNVYPTIPRFHFIVAKAMTSLVSFIGVVEIAAMRLFEEKLNDFGSRFFLVGTGGALSISKVAKTAV